MIRRSRSVVDLVHAFTEQRTGKFGVHSNSAGPGEIIRERLEGARSRQRMPLHARCREWHAGSRQPSIRGFCFALEYALPVPEHSRVNPLPQVLRSARNLREPCGGGFTRERAGTAPQKNPRRFARPQKSPGLPGLCCRRLPTPAQYARSAGPAAGKRRSPARHGRPRTKVRCGTSRCWPPRSRLPVG